FGEVMAAEERLTLDQALRAVTIDAAYILGMEHEVGSIRAGKKADFTVLEQDPYEVPVENLKDIPLWGTVFEGRPFPIEG
ncbi:MAG: amidohydrolase family protein, partial [Alphaproteobacteria bacterium]|nr:amidohydrolase family protein [Alphaproteobacteria bacterium]